MPRRNHPPNRRRRRASKAQPNTSTTTRPRTKSTDVMALELVRTGRASAAILGSHKPPTTEGNNR